MAGDADFGNVVLRLPCDGANNSTTFTDRSPVGNTLTVYGNAKINTGRSKYGGASAEFDGAGDYLLTGSNAANAFGTGDFTLEAWCYFDSVADGGFGSLVTSAAPSGVAGVSVWMVAGKVRVRIGRSAAGLFDDVIGSTSLSPGQWYHMAAVRIGTAVTLYVDGVVYASGTSSRSITATVFCIGNAHTDDAFNVIDGAIDDVRFCNIAKYTAAFTPPALALPIGFAQVSGVVLDVDGDPAARTVRAYRRDTGALIGSAESDPTTGEYVIDCPTGDEVNVICLDDTAGTVENDLILRTLPV